MATYILYFDSTDAVTAFENGFDENGKAHHADGDREWTFTRVARARNFLVEIIELDDASLASLGTSNLEHELGCNAIETDSEFYLSNIPVTGVLNLDKVNRSIFGPFHGKGVRVGLVDGGVEHTHPDLVNKVVSSATFLASTARRDTGHGTAMAGIICGSGASSDGQFAGITPEAELVDCVTFDGDFKGHLSGIIQALDFCVDNGVHVVALPFNARPGVSPSRIFEQVIETLVYEHGMIVCAGAGNHGPAPGTLTMPGSYRLALTAGSIDEHFRIAGFSGQPGQNEKNADIYVPATNIVSLNVFTSTWKDQAMDENEYYASFSGNSVSVAVIAGIATAVKAIFPGYGMEKIKQLLGLSAARTGKGEREGPLVDPPRLFQVLKLYQTPDATIKQNIHRSILTSLILLYLGVMVSLAVISFF